MSKKSEALQAADRADACAELRKLLKPGDTVYTVLKHCSSSGMMRVIDLVIPYTRTDTATVRATAKTLKIGAEGYHVARDMPRAFSAGKVAAFDADTVTFEYEAAAHAPAARETVARDVVSLYQKATRPAIRSIAWLASRATGYTLDRDRGGLKMGGCGMDMGFQAVYSLGRAMWPNGTPKPHGTRNGDPDRDGGYALKHTWL